MPLRLYSTPHEHNCARTKVNTEELMRVVRSLIQNFIKNMLNTLHCSTFHEVRFSTYNLDERECCRCYRDNFHRKSSQQNTTCFLVQFPLQYKISQWSNNFLLQWPYLLRGFSLNQGANVVIMATALADHKMSYSLQLSYQG